MKLVADANFKFILNCHGKKESFDGIVGSGKNATILHYTDNNSPIEKTSYLNGRWYSNNLYASDITALSANGKFTKRQREVYRLFWKLIKSVLNS